MVGPFVLSTNERLEGALAGVSAGYNWRHGAFLYGLEADADFGNVQAWLGGAEKFRASLRARAGYAYERVLLYATAGGALRQRSFYEWSFSGRHSDPQWIPGWTAGAGVQLALNANWSARAEYRHTQFGPVDFVHPAVLSPVPVSARYRDLDRSVRVGVVRNFTALSD